MQIVSERPAGNSNRSNPSEPIAVRIDEVKIYEKRTLRAFINFTVLALGLRVNGAMIHEKDGKSLGRNASAGVPLGGRKALESNRRFRF